MNEKTNSNLEFRKIGSLKYLYEVNENGTIFRNVKSKKQLKIKLDMHHSNTGYYTTFVHIGGRSKDSKIIRVPIHKVVAECWLGPNPDSTIFEIDHIDRNTHNNDYRNLRYVTKSEQMKNRDRTNIAKRGSENLQNASMLRAKSVQLNNFETGESIKFDSYADASRYLSSVYDENGFEKFRSKLKGHRKHIYDYDIVYL